MPVIGGQLLPDYYGDAVQAYNTGRDRARVNGLSQLMGDYYTQQGNPTLAGMAKLDPSAAVQFAGVQDKDRQAKEQQMVQQAMLLHSAPESMRGAMYARMLPTIRQMVPEAPDQYGPDVAQVLDAIAAKEGGSAAGVQASFVDAQGNRVAIMRDGSTKVLGQNAPNNQIVAGDGGYFGVNKGNLQAAPVMMGGNSAPQPAIPPQGNADAVVATAQLMASHGVPDAVIQDWIAKQPGMTPASDSVPPASVPAPAIGQQLRPAPKPIAAAKAPAPTELERRVAMARQMGASEDQIRAMVVGGGQTGNAQTVKTSQATAAKLAQFTTVQRQIDRLEQAAKSIASNKVFDGGPIDQYAIKFTPQGQELEQAGAAIMPVLTALTRVPGVGSQSDLEARLAALQLPSASMPPEVNQRAVASLRAYMADLKSAYENQQRASPAGQPAAPNSGWSIKVKATP